MAAGEGVAVDRHHQHVRQVVRRARAAHERLERGYGGQVKQHGSEQRCGGAALRRVRAQRQHHQRPTEPQPALAEALEKLERAAFGSKQPESAKAAQLKHARRERASVAGRALRQSV